MARQTLQEYLVKLGFETDKAGAAEMVNATEKVEKGIEGIRKAATVFKAVVTGAIVTGAAKLTKSIYDEDKALAETAKQLGKTTEEARAYNTVLAAMGKTADDLKNSKALSETYQDLEKLALSMALPEAETGVANIDQMVISFQQLKVIGSYALQWLYYSVNKFAGGPLMRFRDIFSQLGESIRQNLPQWSKGFGQIADVVLRLASSFVKAAVDIVEHLKIVPPVIWTIAAAILGVSLAIRAGPYGWFILILTAIGLLLDDFYTYLEGGESLFSNFWLWAITAFESVKGSLSKMKDEISALFDLSKDKNGKVQWKAFGVSLGKYLIAGIKTGLSNLGQKIKAFITGDENASWSEVGTAIWTTVSGAIESAASSAIDFWGPIFTKGLNEGGLLGLLTSLLSGACILAAQIKGSIVDAINKLLENGTLSAIWSSIDSIATSLLKAANEIMTALFGDGEATQKFESLGQVLSGTIQIAVTAISEALQLCAGALGLVVKILEKANEMGILDDALVGIAASIAVIAGAKAAKGIADFFLSLSSGTSIVAALNPYLLALAAAIGGIAFVVKKYGKVVTDEAGKMEIAMNDLYDAFTQMGYSRDEDGFLDVIKTKLESQGFGAELIKAVQEAYLAADNKQAFLKEMNDTGGAAFQSYMSGMEEASSDAQLPEIGMTGDPEIDAYLGNLKTTLAEAETQADSTADAISNLQSISSNNSNAADASADALRQIAETESTMNAVRSSVTDTTTAVAAGTGELSASFAADLQAIQAAAQAMAEYVAQRFREVVAAGTDLESGIHNKLKGMPATIQSIFSRISSGMVDSLSPGVTRVLELVSSIKNSLNSIPRNITVRVGTSGASTKFGNGGKVSRPTEATIGDDGTEYVIPVTKPARAIPLLRAAIADLGMTPESIARANGMLGGSPTSNVTPFYASSSVTNSRVSNINIDARSTYRIQGMDAKSNASAVSQKQDMMVRNLKGVFADV